jgi:DNA mismatch endonuclease (patch repair protein)
MADVMTPEQRSRAMAQVRSKNTKPEKRVRSLLHRLGYRFRLHRRHLPGTPDIVLPKHRAAIFVHGCFWHVHPGCARATTPATRIDFWTDKLARNVARDTRNQRELAAAGWRVLVVWECETRDEPALEARLLTFLTDEVAP